MSCAFPGCFTAPLSTARMCFRHRPFENASDGEIIRAAAASHPNGGQLTAAEQAEFRRQLKADAAPAETEKSPDDTGFLKSMGIAP